MHKPRVIVVGAGGISNDWFPAIVAEPVELAAIVELNREAAERQVEKFGLDTEIREELARTLREVEADFIIDLTTPEVHARVTCAALRAGLHVLGEKPMAATLKDARRMVRTAEETGLLYMVGQSRRWIPAHDSIARTVNGGRLGQPNTLNCDFYIGAHGTSFRTEMASPLLVDMAIHHFDMARMFCGRNPVGVYAREYNPAGSWFKGDAAVVCVFEFEDGITFTYRGSWCADGCPTSWHGNWRIVGEKGSIIYANDEAPHGEVVQKVSGASATYKPLQLLKPQVKHSKQRGELRAMLRYLRTGEVPQTECHDNIHSLAMVLGAMESARKGRYVRLDSGR